MTEEQIKVIVKNIFDDTIPDWEKKRAMGEAEYAGTLPDLIRKYHPDYILPDGTVMVFHLAKKLGWI